MYSIHTTAGFIIDSRPYGEAGKMLSIFTRDFGLIRATAQGIRLEKSKLRYFSQLYTFGNFSFVRGKEFWRLTNAERMDIAPLEKISDDSTHDLSHGLIARLATLLSRLLHGEESNPELFDCVSECVRFLYVNNPSQEKLEVLESLIVGRILYKLGYIGHDPELDLYFNSNDVSLDLMDSLKDKKVVINKHINKALKESHL